jgi:hypothetical protein
MILGGMASPVLHPHLIARGADVIHLRDFRRVNFLGGIEGLGHDWASTVVALRALALAEGDRDLYTVGMSGPGYAAIRLGLDLHARAVLALAAPTDLSTAPEAEDGRGRAMIDRTRHRAPHMAADARPLIAAAADPPRFHLWHGAGMPQDRRHAEHLNGLPSVTVRAVEGANRHNVLLDMIERGLLEGALDAFLA